MGIEPSTDIVNRLKRKYPDTWHEWVMDFYTDLSKSYPLSDDAISLRMVIREALAQYAKSRKMEPGLTRRQDPTPVPTDPTIMGPA